MKPWFALLFLSMLAVGCGGPGAPLSPDAPSNPTVSSEQAFKDRIQFISENGAMGSALAGIVEQAEKNGDPALVTDAKQLEKANSPTQAKAIAKKMLEKLK